jgi:predicted GH43/DUF377 family glycosyl hydrolase
VLYHGYAERHVYCMGAVLLDRNDPTKVLRRPAEPILVPEETWEIKIRGDVPNVVFGCANPVVNGEVYLYLRRCGPGDRPSDRAAG